MIRNWFNSIFSILLITSIVIADDGGLTNYKNKKYAEAKAYYERAISIIEDTSAVKLGLGASQYQLGDITNAAKSFEEASKSEKTEIQEKALYNLGNSIYSQQKPKESLVFYRQALELNPNDDDAKFNYELAKYQSQQQPQQDQKQQNQQNQDNQQNNQNNQSNDQNNPQDQPQNTDKDEPDKQEDQDSDSSEQEQRETPKSQKQINAEAILDALKDDEQIHQKVKMAQQPGRKFEKDW